MAKRVRMLIVLAVAIAFAGGFTACGGGGSGSPKKKSAKVVSVSPPNGALAGGTMITIVTANFKDDFGAATPNVFVDGVPASGVAPVNATTVTAVTPPGGAQGLVAVRVDSQGGESASANQFTYDPPPSGCTITLITPDMGDVSPGTFVTIDGMDFDPAGSSVFFDGNSATNIFVFPSGLQITCNAPAGMTTGPVDVQVVPQSGADCTSVNGYIYTGCGFTVTPDSGLFSGGTTVLIDGVGFEPNNVQVFFDGVEASQYIDRTSTTQITCDTPPGASPGFVDVDVVNPGLGTNCTLVGGFEYTQCEITDIQPGNGDMLGGITVTITGDGFDTAGADVEFGTNFAGMVNVSSPTMLTCEAPPSITDGPVGVTVIGFNGRRCDSPMQFTYNTPVAPINCTVTSVMPAQGGLPGGEMVTITGTNFDLSGAGVLIGQRAATNVVVQDATTIDCITPPGAPAFGPVNVSVINNNGGTGTCSGCYQYQAAACNPCTATSMTPDLASSPLNVAGEVTPRTIIGTEFCSQATVEFWQFDPNPVIVLGTILFQDSTTIDVIVPPAPLGPGLVIVVVVNGGAGMCPPAGWTGVYQ
ncbi:MAG: IPT/TIG domain-containing protein [Planctomycetota bacterium]|nr:IPT/TIG domain-containing protein [Planctomycetota bacterium]